MSNDEWLAIGTVAAVLLVILMLQGGRARSTGFNILAFLILSSTIVLGVLSLRDEVDEAACPTPPEGVAAEAQVAKAKARTASEVARKGLRQTRRNAQDPPTPANVRAIRQAERALGTARSQRKLWRPSKVTVAETAKTSFKLGSDLNSGTRSIAFTSDKRIPGPMQLDVVVTPFAGPDAGQELNSADIVAYAELQPGRQNGSIYLCIPSDRRLDVPSGQFTGELVLEPGRTQRLAIPATLSVPNPHFTTVMLVGLGTAWTASWYVFFLRRDDLSDLILFGEPKKAEPAAAALQADNASRVLRWPFGFWHGYWRWVCSISGAITVVAGTAAAITAFSTAYLGSDSWAGSFRDWFALCGAIATAFVAGGTAGKLVQIKPSDSNQPVTQVARRRLP